ncbi:putative DNA internalization-related competence protein [Listeria floridensis FSL S10-1187]|uniref:DNA internalization-related competence protein n=1 Tax=Listeria floridensis FSL S10-1187 TaxID=1265817 RepID=A0ABP3AZ26_9LIST|nr:helix-hairpin-helix domain-containing protein [Listeria floridensis]EUJ32820.1 putative DNA internalization-related competence protein [Listeria floridensis FSL S10-1187]
MTHPGVYQIAVDGRVKDAIRIAGDFLPEADKNSINLAQKLKDEMVITVLTQGDSSSPVVQTGLASDSAEKSKVNLNQATATELEQVPGIGKAKAEAIIAHREKEGLFETVDGLTEVSGIGAKTLEKLKAYLEV